MTRTILAFLTLVATAAGQTPDVVLRSNDYWIGDSPDSISIGWILQRSVDPTYLNRRPYLKFSIPDSPRRIESATLRLALGSGVSDDPYDSRIVVAFRDAGIYDESDVVRSTIDGFYDDISTGAYYGQLDLSADKTTEWSLPRNPYPPYNILGLGAFRSRAPFHDVRLSPQALTDIMDAAGDNWAVGAMILDDPAAINITRIGKDCGTWQEGCKPYFELEINYGPMPPLGDLSGNHLVGQEDLDAVLLNWGTLFTQSELDAVLLTWGHSSLATASAIPEPPTMPLSAACVIIAAIGSLPWSRRPCRH